MIGSEQDSRSPWRPTSAQLMGGGAGLFLAAFIGYALLQGAGGGAVVTAADSPRPSTASAAAVTSTPTPTPSASKSPTEAEQLARQQKLQEETRLRAEARASASAEAVASAAASAEAAAAAKAAFLDPGTFTSLSDRDYDVLLKDPQAHVGEKYVVHGCVTQFDSSTGASSFRASTGGEDHRRCYEYDSNTFVRSGEPGILDRVVQDDEVRMLVVVDGVTTYQTTLGGVLTVPVLTVHAIEVQGA